MDYFEIFMPVSMAAISSGGSCRDLGERMLDAARRRQETQRRAEAFTLLALSFNLVFFTAGAIFAALQVAS
jgi:hypothetical protein